MTVWAGVFPIVVSWWAAVALTAFITAQFLVTSYCRNRKHLKPLWFNSVSNNILWFTFVKVRSHSLPCASAWYKLYSICGHAQLCGVSSSCNVCDSVCYITVNLQTGWLLLHVFVCAAVLQCQGPHIPLVVWAALQLCSVSIVTGHVAKALEPLRDMPFSCRGIVLICTYLFLG